MLSVFLFSKVTRVLIEDFSQQFDINTVCAKHYTVQIKNLPKSFAQYDDEICIKMAIQEQIVGKIRRWNEKLGTTIDPTIIDINFILTEESERIKNIKLI